MTIQALVAGAAIAPTDTTGLWDTMSASYMRSKAERTRVMQELRLAGDGAIIDAFEMFSLKESWSEDRYPTVAFSPLESERAHFTDMEGRCYFSGEKNGVSDGPQMPIANPPPKAAPPALMVNFENPDDYYRFMRQQQIQEMYRSMPGLNRQIRTGIAPAPLVPKSVVPFWAATRRRCWVLFDTPVWEKKAIPVDPYLCERVSDKRMRILAHWDLTPKERQLMALILP